MKTPLKQRGNDASSGVQSAWAGKTIIKTTWRLHQSLERGYWSAALTKISHRLFTSEMPRLPEMFASMLPRLVGTRWRRRARLQRRTQQKALGALLPQQTRRPKISWIIKPKVKHEMLISLGGPSHQGHLNGDAGRKRNDGRETYPLEKNAMPCLAFLRCVTNQMSEISRTNLHCYSYFNRC